MSVKDEILTVLEELGGEVADPRGFATRQLAARIASASSAAQVSTALGQLDREGLVERDQPNLKRCTRIALAGPGVRPGRKSAQVLAEQASRALARELEGALGQTIGALEQAHQAALEAAEERARTHALASERTRRERDQAREERDAALSAYRAVEEELAQAREELQITRHNAEVWQRQALGRADVRRTLVALRDQLPGDQRQALERLMRELPEGR